MQADNMLEMALAIADTQAHRRQRAASGLSESSFPFSSVW